MNHSKIWPLKFTLAAMLILMSLITVSRFEAQENTPAPEVTPEAPLEAGTIAKDLYGYEMVYVPAGTVQMGISRERLTDLIQQGVFGEDAKANPQQIISTAEEQGVLDTVDVKLPAYWIDRYEVTIEQYQKSAGDCMKSNRCAPINLDYAPYLKTDVHQPQMNVNWFDSVRFCMNRSARLPTEAEWEYAVSGPEDFIYPWGNNLVLENLAMDKTSYPVGSRPNNVSWVGAYDLAGNGEEWVEDRMKPYTDSPSAFTILQHQSDVSRVLRGGSYRTSIFQMSAFARHGDNPDSQDEMGFRCARSSTPEG